MIGALSRCAACPPQVPVCNHPGSIPSVLWTFYSKEAVDVSAATRGAGTGMPSSPHPTVAVGAMDPTPPRNPGR